MKYAALLFDLDGTLINSIDLWGEAVRDSFATIGISVSQETFHGWYTGALHLPDWLAQYGLTEDKVPTLREWRNERYRRLLREKVRWCHGAKEALEYFRGKLPTGLVTGSWTSFVDASDTALGLKKFFDAIVTEDDMGRFMKPHPHGLLLAADRLGVDPARCLYVGDQLFDVEACERAGMGSCIVHGTYTTDDAIQRADIVVKSLEELRAVAEL